tara:strand:- start:393 stop:1481 length:1089 start_codon:yes stop_codon:yes gene_type:complete
MSHKPIYVTKPSLAPIEEFYEIIQKPWDSGILTHNGPLVQKFENVLASKLNIQNYIAVSNGTIALQMAIKALGVKNEVITSPFTWIATISALKWEKCKPVFCDIDPQTLNIDPNRIEDCITENTTAIMPIHVFGNPCDVLSIEKIAKKYQLKVIYDAAHAIGSTHDESSILEYGDISATSTHSTKLLNTAEGGGCVTKNDNLNQKLKRIRFFGHDEEKNIVEDGFNGKMTEVHAAMGLANLRYFNNVLEDRQEKYQLYMSELVNLKDITFQKHSFGKSNHCYFPVIFKNEEQLLRVHAALNKENIYPRRYFYPSANTFTKILDFEKCEISERISRRIMCLPLFYDLNKDIVFKIVKIIKNYL